MTPSATPGSTAPDPLWWAWSDSRAIRLADRALVKAFGISGVSLDASPVRAARAALHRGSRVACPICGRRFRHFAATPRAVNEQCWQCGSHARHRVLRLMLGGSPGVALLPARDVLHFAPEPFLESWLRPQSGTYTSGDIDPAVAQLGLDVMSLDLPDDAFDLIICSHVLEHVPDDETALRELRRVLRSTGHLVVMVPIDYELPTTDADPTISDPAERARRFWQEDHVRLYGADVAEQIARGGFTVETLRPRDVLGPEAVERHALGYRNDVLLCRPV